MQNEKNKEAVGELSYLLSHLNAIGKPDDHVLLQSTYGWNDKITVGHLRQLLELSKLGLEILEMPANSSLSNRPMSQLEGFPTGTFSWEFSRPGELLTCAQDPYMALVFHKIPEGGPIPDGKA